MASLVEIMQVYDAVVIGAGMAGATAASRLAGYGWHVLAVDRDTFPRHKVCGEFLSPEAVALLATVGVEAPISGATAPPRLTLARLHPAGGSPLEVTLPAAALGWSRYALDSALHGAARLAGAELRTGTDVTAVDLPEREGGTYRVRLRQGGAAEEVRARAVIAAWGRRPRAGLPGTDGRKMRRTAHVGVKLHLVDVYGVGGAEPTVDMFFDAGGYCGTAPVEGGCVNVAALMRSDAFRAAGGTVEAALAALAVRQPPLHRLLASGAVVPGSVCAVAPVAAARMPVAWHGLPRIGDAAAFIPPLCGDGMAMALRSALLCAELADACLGGRLAPGEWERRYRAALQREFAAPIRWGRLLQAGLRHPPLTRLLAELGRRAPALPLCLVRATRLRD